MLYQNTTTCHSLQQLLLKCLPGTVFGSLHYVCSLTLYKLHPGHSKLANKPLPFYIKIDQSTIRPSPLFNSICVELMIAWRG